MKCVQLHIHVTSKSFVEKISLIQYCILGGMAVLSIIIPTALTISENWPATTILPDPSGTYFEWNYVKPWCRFSPYIVGLLLGYILHVTKNKAVKINTSVAVWIWLCAFGIGFAVIYGLDLPSAMDPNNSPSKFVNAFYGGFHRAAWGIALGWLIFACCKGYGGEFDDIKLYNYILLLYIMYYTL